MKQLVLLALLLAGYPCGAQGLHRWADSLRRTSEIPELAYAVVSSGQVLAIDVSGTTRATGGRPASINDRFRIGSNTKAITAFIAAQLVEAGKIRWDSRFFDLFPALKAGSNSAYHNLRLEDLITLRTRLVSYTYTWPEPTKAEITGDAQRQRYLFVQWCMRQPPVSDEREFRFANPAYAAAALMLEKAAGTSYAALVEELGRALDISFRFGQPNNTDVSQPWGHSAGLVPEPPARNEKLEWLQAAGNLQVSLPDYAKFIRLQLQGLRGKSYLLPAAVYQKLHFGKAGFAYGWFWQRDGHNRRYSWHVGNPGSFLSKVYLFPDEDRAFILFANAQTEKADRGLDLLYARLQEVYLR